MNDSDADAYPASETCSRTRPVCWSLAYAEFSGPPEKALREPSKALTGLGPQIGELLPPE